jgi:hypothetical protein
MIEALKTKKRIEELRLSDVEMDEFLEAESEED